MLKVLLLVAAAPSMALVPASPMNSAVASQATRSASVTSASTTSDDAASTSTTPSKSLLVVGAGVLGRRIAAQYHERGLGKVTAETRSETNHGAILEELPFLGR